MKSFLELLGKLAILFICACIIHWLGPEYIPEGVTEFAYGVLGFLAFVIVFF